MKTCLFWSVLIFEVILIFYLGYILYIQNIYLPQLQNEPWEKRRARYENAAQKSEELIAAIEQYENQNGYPPISLEYLIPDFINKIPSTGLYEAKEFKYSVFQNSSWELRIDFTRFPSDESGVVVDFDTFIYWPSEKYPKYSERHGGYTEQIGKWAYVHE